ncbi:MAG: WYL domain-containing protein [Cyanothece sp. SIO2G6]|nr:WYL domain-containing protein [Cyanothece sp. SIO2G6]
MPITPPTPPHVNSPHVLVCHILIGPPASGKSTLAAEWCDRATSLQSEYHHPQTVIVSSDDIRERLYGDAQIQGNWAEIETQVLAEIDQALQAGLPVIYDATNARRQWRLGLMQKIRQLDQGQCRWMGWVLPTTQATCLARNQGRSRQVPEWVIEQAFQQLKRFKPVAAEGFTVVNPVPMKQGQVDFAGIDAKISRLDHTLSQRANRQSQFVLHAYSGLLEFERLLYLMATLLNYPGVGTLHRDNPQWLCRELQGATLPRFATPVAEIAALVAAQHGAIYGDEGAIAQNLHWLETNGLVNTGHYTAAAIAVDPPTVTMPPHEPLHPYADRAMFERLMHLIRLIAHHPFAKMVESKTPLHETLATTMQQYQLYYGADTLRRDIGDVLKPYGIVPNAPMRQGYYLGTSILAPHELLQLYRSVAGQAQHIDDPIALNACETLRQRLGTLKLEVRQAYPVRTVVNRTIVKADYLPDTSLAHPHNAELLETAIAQGQLLELRQLRGTGRFEGADEGSFTVLPLQIVFYNIAWYLGYQQHDTGLLAFIRLDRFAATVTGFTRSPGEQEAAQQQLHTLLAGSFSLFLGTDAEEQQMFLDGNRDSVTDTLELWCNHEIYPFISEGTQRLPQLKLSPKVSGAVMEGDRALFSLKPTNDPRYPHRLRATLPVWSFRRDVELRAWILRFGGQMKVVQPEGLARVIQQYGKEIVEVYS